ncbi:hypothetical protein BGW36DRAFT_293482 [Talaromyces proteolyticus]|uniref:NmrA-like domain-containing protein n=1 Tax=Talaromyces proteolyticus TaxID=1131652 RepID=A0AAD4KSC9_9EURO|nr:uncharacterized protein BGW36DRAFT_293482 [Talaromyces proteolyticus]KAH8698327.1 hypothetical protein BGW36DRAFT_293482 [Talaromyces proteolyticus]
MRVLNIGVFPASGPLAGSIIEYLTRIITPSQLTLCVQSPEALCKAKARGATIREADYNNKGTLDRAFDGLDVLNLLSYRSLDNEHRIKVHRDAIDAARRIGVGHILYTSLAFGGGGLDLSAADIMQAHLATETYLAETQADDKSFTYTIARAGIFSRTFPLYTGLFNPKASPTSEDAKSVISIPHDGSGPGIAWAKQEEIGEAIARLLIRYVRGPQAYPYENKKIVLSGPRALSLRETANVLGRAVNRRLRVRQVALEEYLEQPRVRQFDSYDSDPKALARSWATVFEAIRRGECAVTTTSLENLLGREPEEFETTINRMVKVGIREDFESDRIELQ